MIAEVLRFALFSSLVPLFFACGYRFQDSIAQQEEVQTITVPYVKGDIEGGLTAALIRAITSSGAFICCQEGGELILDVSLVEQNLERIGYRYLREHPSGKRQNNLVGTENRLNVAAQVTLTRPATEEVVLGPVIVRADVDFDYVDPSSIRDLAFINSKGKPQTSIQFSLGQLDSVEGAQDASLTPVYRRLAQKIVEGIMNLGS